ncbi:MAG: helix-turn-helix domain-containing protein [Clostridiales bacterium]|nr:helix-turn-helix domain-containing protein [Clostridiales bacterium]
MVIPKIQMQRIAEEVGATIKNDVNIMDRTGCIIASTDPQRIGALHVGAVNLMESQLPELIVEKDCQGMKKGINLPLVIKDEIIGVVGITGDVDDVRTLGVVIKKMTEILILDWYKNNQKLAVEELERSFLIELLFGDDSEKNELESEMLHINVNEPKIISVLQICTEENYSKEQEQQNLENLLARIKREIHSDLHPLIVRLGMKIIIVHNAKEEELVSGILDNVTSKLRGLYKCRLFCGIGGVSTDKTGLRKSYQEANMACHMAKIEKQEKARIYTKTDISMLLINIPAPKREAFLNEIFKKCSMNQKSEILQCMKSYVKNNGSISKISEELFIHKNTLQYRLSKMKLLTGYDPRILEEAVPLIIALYFDGFHE